MIAATTWQPKRGVQMQTNRHINKRLMLIITGLASLFLALSLASCTPQPTPVFKTIPAPRIQVPSELTAPLVTPNCLFKSNANLGDCILMQSGVIERANADRAAVRKIVEGQ